MARYIVLDTESGGLDPQVHSLLSVGAVVWEDGRILDETEILVLEDPIIVTAKALEVNRINLVEHAKVALPPWKALSNLRLDFHAKHFCDTQAVIVAHNAEHDVGFMRRLFRLGDPERRHEPYDAHFSHRKLDTAGILRYLHLVGRVPESAISSDGWIEHFGIKVPREERHTALGDARATAQLLTKLVDMGAATP